MRILLPAGNTIRPENSRKTNDGQRLLAEVNKLVQREKLCRITLLFPAPPFPGVVKLANELAGIAAGRAKVECAWLRRAGEDHSPRLADRFVGMKEGV